MTLPPNMIKPEMDSNIPGLNREYNIVFFLKIDINITPNYNYNLEVLQWHLKWNLLKKKEMRFYN